MANELICNQDHPVYCSITPENDEDRATIYNMAMAPSHKISEILNQQIIIKNIYAEMIEGVDSETGETWSAPRIVLQDVSGETYCATSTGLLRACQRIIALWGPAPWPNGIPATVVQLEKNGRRVFSLKM